MRPIDDAAVELLIAPDRTRAPRSEKHCSLEAD
jgi:hypothetical protein